MLGNRFGHFDPSGRSFQITDPATPMPWTNVVCNGRYGFVVSQNGGGFSWFDNSQLNVLTRWEMDLARDDHGRWLYVSDLESGRVWSLTPMPCRTRFDSYRCTHEPGRTTFETEHEGVRASWTLAVAPEDPVEVWAVTLENTSGRERRLRIASFFEWCCGAAPDAKREFHRLFFTVRHDAARGAIFATKNMWDVPPRTEAEHWNRPWPFVAAHAVCGVEFERGLAIGDKGAFFGRYGDPARPEAMTEEVESEPTFGRFGDAAASLGGDLVIPAGGSVRLHYLLTIGGSEHEAEALVARYSSPRAAEEAVDAAAAAWERRLSPTRVKTERPDFDLLNNWWLPYQAISGRLWGRTGYYQQSGAFGFRDQLQDSQVWLPLEPERCREQILLHAAHQFEDGSVYHWWHPLLPGEDGPGLRTACSDDYLWLPFVTANYLKETGDWGVLREGIPFVDGRHRGIEGSRHRAGGEEGATNGASLLEHCLRAFRRAFSRTSPRGLPLIGACDWNDGLSAMGVEGRGESVWLGLFLCALLGEWATVLERVGDGATAEEFRSRRRGYVEAINRHAWDGAWFRGATRDDGRWIGDSASEEGSIQLNPQTWAIMAEAAEPARLEAAWASVKEHLLREMGPLLLSPAYTKPDATIGYITRYAPGLRENGGVYMHAATWALMAACKRRDVEAVERIWGSIAPPVRALDADAYRAEPYVTPGNVDGPRSRYPGRAGWTWYTGSAAWLNRVSLEWVLGVRPVWTEEGEGLLVDPCPPASLGMVDVVRSWRGSRVRVRFDARAYRAGAAARLVVDGKPLGGNVLPAPRGAGGEIDVRVGWEERATELKPLNAGRAV